MQHGGSEDDLSATEVAILVLLHLSSKLLVWDYDATNGTFDINLTEQFKHRVC